MESKANGTSKEVATNNSVGVKNAGRRKPKQKRALEKYQAILDASIVVLMREGYDGANTSNISKEADVAVGSLYEYFPNKESIYMAYLDERIGELVSMIQKAMEQSPLSEGVTPSELLHRWLLVLVEAFTEYRELLKTLVSQIPGVLDLPSLKDMEKQLLPLARFLAVNSSLTEVQVETKTHVLTNALFGFLIRNLFSETHLSSQQTAQELFNLITGYAATE